MKIDIKAYLDSKELTIYQVSKYSGYWVHDLAQVIQQEANKCDISEFKRFWMLWHNRKTKRCGKVLKELEEHYLSDDN